MCMRVCVCIWRLGPGAWWYGMGALGVRGVVKCAAVAYRCVGFICIRVGVGVRDNLMSRALSRTICVYFSSLLVPF